MVAKKELDFASSSINIGSLLGNDQQLYRVPVLQRRYVWQEEDVDSLLEDIEANMKQHSDSGYFVGGMVFAHDEDSDRLMVIDGQQRLATFVLVLSALSDFLGDEIKKSTDGVLVRDLTTHQAKQVMKYARSKISTPSNDENGIPFEKHYLHLNDRDNDFFTMLVGEDQSEPVKHENPIQKNLLDAKLTARRFLERKAKESSFSDLAKYMKYYYERVYVVTTVARNRSTAFRVFMTLNYRGIALEPEDLVKALFLSRAESEQDVGQFAFEWEEFIKNLTKGSRYVVKTSTFLKHFIMSRGQYVTKDDVFEYFEKKYGAAPKQDVLAILKDLKDASHQYRRLNDGSSAVAKTLNAMSFRQGYIPLISKCELDPEVKKKLDFSLESLAISQTILHLRTNEFEDLFCEIAKGLTNVAKESGSDIKAVNKLFNYAMKKKEMAIASFAGFHCETKADESKITFILRKMGKALDGANYDDWTLEHILPQIRTPGWSHILEEEYEDLCHSFGNLTILTGSENSSNGAGPWADKRQVYSTVASRLVTSLARPLETGTVESIYDKAIRSFGYQPPAGEWDSREIVRRGEAMSRLAAHIWFVYEEQ